MILMGIVENYMYRVLDQVTKRIILVFHGKDSEQEVPESPETDEANINNAFASQDK